MTAYYNKNNSVVSAPTKKRLKKCNACSSLHKGNIMREMWCCKYGKPAKKSIGQCLVQLPDR